MAFHPEKSAEKYQLAIQRALKDQPEGGVCGFEMEWNLLDQHLRPLLTVGTGPSHQSFVDHLRSRFVPDWARAFSQLEVFHWMIEWFTRPYYDPRGAVYEGRLFEGVLMNAVQAAGKDFGEPLYITHGNLYTANPVGADAIPLSWHIAKRRYLERCVNMYGEQLATAGNHTNLSLPEPLLAWDYMHLPPAERQGMLFEEYKSRFYVVSARLMRAFAALFIASSASTPFQAVSENGKTQVFLTAHDSVRNLTFPNPESLDVPDLYRSYDDYLRISYNLVRRGIRFGNNNWTPIRARSFSGPVEQLISVSSEHLHDLYARGVYSMGETTQVEEMAKQIEIENLLARINLPMSRVEIRVDDGGHSMAFTEANLILKHLLLIRFYEDQEFGRAFRYDQEDIQRARRNETLAAQDGLRATIENPFTGKPVGMRKFLRWTLDQVIPLADALGLREELAPLEEVAAGAPGTAEKIRQYVQAEIGDEKEVPTEVLKKLYERRQQEIQEDLAYIAARVSVLGEETGKLEEVLQRARNDVRLQMDAPIRFKPKPEELVEIVYSDKTAEVVHLAEQLIKIPSVTVGGEIRMEEVRRAATLVYDYLNNHRVGVRMFMDGQYPAVLASFPGKAAAPAMLSGHFDVVAPEPDDRQFQPRIEGDYLWGRGAADMKTVVATYLVWMKDQLRAGPPYPDVNLLLVGNEENGETDPIGTPHVLQALASEGYHPEFFIAGERTEEVGTGLWGEICVENRGVSRFTVVGRGQRSHSGMATVQADLTLRMIQARAKLVELAEHYLTLKSPDAWKSQIRFPFIQVGMPGVYNITADHGQLGVEIRMIPQDRPREMVAEFDAYCQENGLEIVDLLLEEGIACDPENIYLKRLVQGVAWAKGSAPVISKKLAGTSARFAPKGNGVVWGQSGIGPHARDERHYLPSILPYYNALVAFGDLMKTPNGPEKVT